MGCKLYEYISPPTPSFSPFPFLLLYTWATMISYRSAMRNWPSRLYLADRLVNRLVTYKSVSCCKPGSIFLTTFQLLQSNLLYFVIFHSNSTTSFISSFIGLIIVINFNSNSQGFITRGLRISHIWRQNPSDLFFLFVALLSSFVDREILHFFSLSLLLCTSVPENAKEELLILSLCLLLQIFLSEPSS